MPPVSAVLRFSKRRYSLARMATLLLSLGVSAASLPARAQTPAPKSTPAASSKVRMAMTAAFVSESGMPVYGRIATYLSKKLGTEVSFVTGQSYGDVDKMLDAGSVEVAFVCGLPYVLKHDANKNSVHLVAAPVMKDPRYGGKPKYFSDLVVRKDSKFKKLEDLRGATFVYNEEASNSGYNLPRYKMLKLGLTQGFFGKLVRSGSHEESIRMVATGKADASFVDSLVLDFDRETGNGWASEVKVIDSLGPAGIPPVVVSGKASPELRKRIKDALITMSKDPDGRRILDDALVDRFVEVDDSNYNDIRQQYQAAVKAGFTTIK